MGSINVDFTLDITVDGQYVGLSCNNVWDMSCCAERGTWNIVYYQGMVMPLAPNSSSIPFDGEGGNESQKVFCDPCKDKCFQDGNIYKYDGDQKWLFETYVNSSPEPQPIYLAQFTVSKNWKRSKFSNNDCGTPYEEELIQDATAQDILSVGDQSVCCVSDEIKTYYMQPVAKELKDLLVAFKQPVINFNGDPSEACLCGCPGFCGPTGDDCAGIGQILSLWRDLESNKCVIDG